MSNSSGRVQLHIHLQQKLSMTGKWRLLSCLDHSLWVLFTLALKGFSLFILYIYLHHVDLCWSCTTCVPSATSCTGHLTIFFFSSQGCWREEWRQEWMKEFSITQGPIRRRSQASHAHVKKTFWRLLNFFTSSSSLSWYLMLFYECMTVRRGHEVTF